MLVTITISTTTLAIIFGSLLALGLITILFRFLQKKRNTKKVDPKPRLSTEAAVASTTVRVDEGKSYHTQRNNKIRPFGTCASTSMAMALRYSGYSLKFIPEDIQDEDYITNFIHTNPAVINFWQNNSQKWIRDAYTGYLKYKAGQQKENDTMFGNEIAEVLQFATNTMMGSQVDSFAWQCPIQKMLYNLIQGGAVVTSGVWPYKSGTPIHHVICMTGFKTKQLDVRNVKKPDFIDLSMIDGIMIDDPYGDYHTLYRSDQGNDIFMPYFDFISVMNEPGNKIVKRAHLITPLKS